MDPIFREPPSGQIMKYGASKVGLPIIVQPDGTLAPGGGGGPGGATFSDILYVDSGTTNTTGNGSILTPYKALAAALAVAAPNTVIYCTPEGYNTEGTLAPINNVMLIGMSADGPNGFAVQAINTTHTLIVENMVALAGITSTSGFTAINCNIFGIANTGGGVTLKNTTEVGNVSGATLATTNSTIVGNITLTAGTASFDTTKFASAPVLTFTGPAGTATFDSVSYNNFMAAGGTIVNGSIASNDPNVPKLQLTIPQTLANGGAGAYVTLTADGGASFAFDCTGIAAGAKIEVGIDATATDATTGTHSELRANRTYVMAGGVPTLLNDSTVFTPAIIAGNAAVQLAIVGATLALQGWKIAAGGHDQKFVGLMYVNVSTVS